MSKQYPLTVFLESPRYPESLTDPSFAGQILVLTYPLIGNYGVRKGTNGVSTNGVTANFLFFDRGTFWVLPLTYFYLPKSARAYLFSQSVEIHYFCSGPIGVDPICPETSPMFKVFRASLIYDLYYFKVILAILSQPSLSQPRRARRERRR